ncbi:MAG: hypothetical protein ACOC6P_01005 [Candidatus Aminicenantaceae bacterium]
MKEMYTWNPYSDQPDISIPKKRRFWRHCKRLGSYVSLASANLLKAVPVLSLYRKYWNSLYKNPCSIGDPFAVSVSPLEKKNSEIIELLKETGVSRTLVRVHSWDKERLSTCDTLCHLLKREGLDLSIALLQERKDVLNPVRWQEFVDHVFSRFKVYSSFFEIGHAWNRAKWGLWDYKEYLKLSRHALFLARKHGVRLVGPAVIDFEFHLYPPVLKEIPFDVVSSLLYVDRVGAPENKQSGWDTSRKLALLRAVVDGSLRNTPPLWITEVNWPLKGTGKYSPVSGEPNVTEEEQASYLVRYYVLCLASGFVDRIYWWQLIAPGYGLIDSRDKPWRRRPSFYAFKNMVAHLEGARFIEKLSHSRIQIFLFRKKQDHFAIVWAKERVPWEQSAISMEVNKVINRDGKKISFKKNELCIDGNPCYVFFK